jgi:Ion channel
LMVSCGSVAVWRFGLWATIGLLSLKLLAIIGAIPWVSQEGSRYVSRLQGIPKANSADPALCFTCNRLGALRSELFVFPLGLMDHILVAPSHGAWHCGTWWGVVWRSALGIARALLFRLSSLVLLGSALLVAAPLAIGTLESVPRRFLAVLAVVAVLAMAIELVCGLAVLGLNYSQLLHGRITSGWKSTLLHQLVLLRNLVLISLLAASTMCYTFYTLDPKSLHAHGIPKHLVTWADAQKVLVDCAYFSMTTIATIGYGDIHPKSADAKAGVCVVQAIGFLVLVLAVQSVFMIHSATSHQQVASEPLVERRRNPRAVYWRFRFLTVQVIAWLIVLALIWGSLSI